VSREINLNGGEITILKTIGLSGEAMAGKVLIERADELEAGELIDTLDGLLTMGYVLSNRPNIRSAEDIERAFFRVNPSYAKELRDVLQPARRQAREQRERRRRS
jgi:hypothetical protein